MDYGRIVRRAFEVTWRHKALWVFGIAAALFGTGYSGMHGSGPVQYVINQSDLDRWSQSLPLGRDLAAAVPVILAIIGALLIVALVFTIVGVIVRYASIGALIGMVDEVERTERTSFGAGLRIGWQRLLRLFAVDLLIGVGVFVVVIALIVLAVIGILVAVVPAVAISQANGGPANLVAILWGVGIGLAVLLLLVVAAVVLSAATTLMRELSFRANVLEHTRVVASIGTAFQILRTNLKEVLVVWLVLVAINLALSVVLMPLVVIGLVAVIGPTVASWALTESVAVTGLVGIALSIIVMLVSAFVGGLVLTFTSAVWTLAYRELRADHLVPEAV